MPKTTSGRATRFSTTPARRCATQHDRLHRRAESAATALSLPLLNEGGILQISPSSTYIGLTRPGSAGGASPSASTRRRCARSRGSCPPTTSRPPRWCGYMRAEGVRRLAILNDRDIYGTGLADQVAEAWPATGHRGRPGRGINTGGEDFSGPAERVAESGADAFFFAATRESGAARGSKRGRRGRSGRPALRPDERGRDGVRAARCRPQLQRRMRITSPSLRSARAAGVAHAVPQGRSARSFGRDARAVRDLRLRGDERGAAGRRAMPENGQRPPRGGRRVLPDRGTVARCSARTRSMRGGDTSLSRYAGRRVRDGRLVFDKVLAVGR